MPENTEDIVNRVAQSKLVTFNLEDYYPAGRRVLLDIKDWLHQGIVLREKEYRNFVAEHDWELYQDAFVGLTCSTDAIIPGWAYMLIMTKLQPYALRVVIGDLEQLETSIFQSVITDIDVSEYKGKPVIIKGCTKRPVPANAYIWITAKLQTVAKSVMYGEACSSVPLFKK
ncbi:DUF2480 family protein [Flavobacteriaceae bacterium F89]|uniref:DUF2480 family protein n=1 Tax=Cerina litoralis TaxID=2874477 RepID=A0AAE3JPC8_9FLAO|nr:DUF2480 family protein [Cerina litoralis]MCG2460906.1 DUF2480 family protein [Cerina litoralis]